MDNKNHEKLLDIFKDEMSGLLDVKIGLSHILSEDERLISTYQEISDFYENNNKEPEEGKSTIETLLYYRLKAIRESKFKMDILIKSDRYNLLNKLKEKEIKSINDIFENDSLGILDSECEDIFKLEHVSKVTTMPDYIGSRKPCKDFVNYENLFKQCQLDLRSGIRELYPFTRKIKKGYFFILKGILLYVADIGERKREKGVVNARLRCIFENGTESDMLLRSLSAELYKNGRRVTVNEDLLLDNYNKVSEEDVETGFIYILKSKSEKLEVKSIENLYKIGFTIMSVEERIKNAEQETTYLMAPVSIITVFKCYNMNPQKLEQLLHNFFGNSCLNIDILDKKGCRHTPREWFIAPLHIIEKAIHFILTGRIVDFKYDSYRHVIVSK